MSFRLKCFTGGGATLYQEMQNTCSSHFVMKATLNNHYLHLLARYVAEW